MSTINTIRQMLADRMSVDINTIQPETTLEEVGIDSLGLFDLIFDAEYKFDIKIDNNNLQSSIKTIQDIADLIDKIKESK